MIALEALATHSYYERDGTRVLHVPGERFTIADETLAVWTAEQLAEVLIAAQLARLAPSPRPPKKKP
jgi:hypothetical protein